MDTSNLPPSPKGRQYELRGIALREFARKFRDTEPLDPFELARFAGLLVVSFEDIEALLSEEARKELLGQSKDSWSGGAASHKLPNGKRLIILNPLHSRNRQNATLMEEISHVFLGHKPSRLAIKATGRKGEALARDYHAEIEEEAYSVGAAALVPFSGLRKLIREGKNLNQISRRYGVSKSLVEFRMKVGKLWEEYKSIQNKAWQD